MTLPEERFTGTKTSHIPRGPHLPGEPCNHPDGVKCSSSKIPYPRTIPSLSYSPIGNADDRLYRGLLYNSFEPEFSVLPSNRYRDHLRGSSGCLNNPIGVENSSSMAEHDGAIGNLHGRSSNYPDGDIPTSNTHTDTSHSGQDRISPGPGSHHEADRDVEQASLDTTPPEDDNEEPLNGRTAWLHAATGFFVVANCWGLTNCWGLFQAYYEILYLHGTSPSSIAWIGSTQLALVFGLGFPVGKLVDMGYFHAVFRTGTFLMILGIFCTAWCTRLPTLWVTQGLLTGTGMGFLFCSGSKYSDESKSYRCPHSVQTLKIFADHLVLVTAMMTWFDEKKISIAMGLAAAGSCLGGIVYILLLRHLLVHQGFATTMFITGTVAAVTIVPANFIFRMRGQATALLLRSNFLGDS